MVTKERLGEILKSINKKLDLNITLGDDPEKIIRRVSTGEPLLDDILGGGLPRGGVTMVQGRESVGKTYICQRAIAQVQRDGGTAAYIDVEYSYDPAWFEQSGVDISRLIVVAPDSAEQALDVTIELCKAGIDIVVVDSVAALLPEEEDEKSMEDYTMGLHARLLNKFFRKVSPHNKNTALVLINQLRSNIGVYRGADIAPGGQGQRYFAKVRLEVKQGELIWSEDTKTKQLRKSLPIGFYIELFTSKNKTSQPLKACEVPFYFSGETDTLFQIVQIAQTYGIIDKNGAWFSFKGEKTMGREKLLDILRDNDELRNSLISDVEEAIKSNDS